MWEAKVFVPLLSGLIGALIGGAVSIITIVVQTRSQNKRDRMRMVTELALEDYRQHLDLALKTNNLGGFPPLVTYLHYHLEIMELAENGNLTPDELRRVSAKNKRLCDSLKAQTKREQDD
ncbi:MAG: hypothetical protein GKR87_08505 [Kiritimatiellae bacterium]|nr:hypothetical protein [Kiritimatiellia bacterium]